MSSALPVPDLVGYAIDDLRDFLLAADHRADELRAAIAFARAATDDDQGDSAARRSRVAETWVAAQQKAASIRAVAEREARSITEATHRVVGDAGSIVADTWSSRPSPGETRPLIRALTESFERSGHRPELQALEIVPREVADSIIAEVVETITALERELDEAQQAAATGGAMLEADADFLIKHAHALVTEAHEHRAKLIADARAQAAMTIEVARAPSNGQP